MPQTRVGAIKICAVKAGVTVARYLANVNAGLKWCYACKDWHGVNAFGVDRGRYDGLTALCVEQRKKKSRERYIPVPLEQRRPMGPPPYAPRDGDKQQARQRINVLVRTGRKSHPNTIPCSQCGHIWEKGDKRHEYSHYLGYSAQYHYTVRVECTTCHARTDRENGLFKNQRHGHRGRFVAPKDCAEERRLSHG